MADYHSSSSVHYGDDGTGASGGAHPTSNAAGGAPAYVDFNQFVMQHNLAQQNTLPLAPPPPIVDYAIQYVGAATVAPVADSAYYSLAAAPCFPDPTLLFDMDVVRKSNLLATASEFVPHGYVAAKTVDSFPAPAPAPAPNVPAAVAEAAAAPSPPQYEQQIATQAAAVTLSPSQGAIRKTFANNNNNNSNTTTNHNNNTGGGRGQAQRGQQQQQQSDRGHNGRSNNRQQHQQPPSNNGWSEGNDEQRNNWRDQRRQTGGTGGGSGRTQSQYNDDRTNYAKEYGQSYDVRRTESQHGHVQRNNGVTDRDNGSADAAPDRNGGRNQRNPFGRQSRHADQPYQQQQQQQSQHSRPTSAASANGGAVHPKPSPFNNHYREQPRDHHQRSGDYQRSGDHQRAADHYQAAAERQSSDAQPAAAGGGAKKAFDKKKHPEFKANRNLKAADLETADDRRTGECSQREKLIREIDAGRLECLVCCENIKPFQSTWCCANCFHIIHLSCIIKWANSSKDEAGWRCPACQHVTKPIPDAYMCFCGKTRNPQYNRNDVAHSCGELCGKQDGCAHACTLLCHPGPCATCHAQVTRECGCGRTKRTMQCCQKEDVQCALICDKLMACGVHRCTLVCHTGACETCDDQVEHRCHCGKDKKMVACVAANNDTTRYSCRKLCNRQLACKLHKCKRVCHADDCGDCQLLPANVTSCPCGSQPIAAGARTVCTDPVPLCAALCQRPLACGQPAQPHRCASKCHTGACPPCDRETAVRCRCGLMEQLVKCRTLQTRSDDARCKKRCVKKRNCGKHKCNQECCIDIDHVCPLPCTFQLSCGKHKCDQTCHKGRCQRCYRSSFVELYCECRAQVIYPPVPCGSKRPACDRPCSRQHACAHPVTHNCHAQAQCPPCMAFVAIRCHGGHEERKTIPCSQGEFSCGLKCGRTLRCARHRCVRTCHAGDCEKAGEVCRQSCARVRIMCGHRCVAPCHEGDCPDTACREQVEVLCQCGHRKQARTCQEFANEYRRIASAKFATTMDDMQQGGGSVELSDVLGPIKMSNNKTLECNEECRVLERNRRLALGLQIRNPDTAAKYAPKYSEFAKTWARKDPQLVGMIHDKLSELVKLAKQSQQKSRSHSFPTMNWEKRQLVHEMCQAFGIEAVSYDAEPNRNVVASATRDTSWLPSLSLLEALKRESGQRRIPVPMNNAWGAKR